MLNETGGLRRWNLRNTIATITRRSSSGQITGRTASAQSTLPSISNISASAKGWPRRPTRHLFDVRNYAWRDYGLRVGIWRDRPVRTDGIADVPSDEYLIYDYAPQISAKIRERGDEFVGHGVTNSEEQGGYPRTKRILLRARRASVPMKAMVPAAGWGRGFRKVPTRGSATRTDIAISWTGRRTTAVLDDD